MTHLSLAIRLAVVAFETVTLPNGDVAKREVPPPQGHARSAIKGFRNLFIIHIQHFQETPIKEEMYAAWNAFKPEELGAHLRR